ncbi:MAG: acetate/propionate family kinase [candidate division KSB1 bacterium]|nr:acetate/propionate family kinase [candidate division KSB1 bacterium]
MNLIICNIGSTSLKFQLLEMPAETERARGHVERIGSTEATITYWVAGAQVARMTAAVANHREAVQEALSFLTSPPHQVLGSVREIDGVGFKTVQAGELSGSVLLTDEVLQAMEDFAELAPAHNPPYLAAIRMFRQLLPSTPLVGVFEPGFHTSAPDYAKVYGAPYEWFANYGVRRYGYHGASHRFVAQETVRLLHLPPEHHRIISCHLGGSSSLCAIKDGVSVDTSMGFTPQSGLIQGTRIGDMDPFVLPYIMKKKGITLDQALQECCTNGGLKGLSGVSEDMRDIKAAIARGDRRALLARNKFIYDVKRYIGEYLVILEGVDAIVFAGGIGQSDAELRAEVLASLGFLGMKVEPERNRAHGPIISADDSRIAALVVRTNEEIVVARETMRVIKSTKQAERNA